MEPDILTGSVIGDEAVLSMEDLARACPAEVSWIAELVEVDLLTPQGVGSVELAIPRGGSSLCPPSRPPATGFSVQAPRRLP